MKFSNFVRGLVFLISIVSFTYGQGDQPGSLTLMDAIQLALANQPILNEAKDYVNAAASKVEEQKSFNFPQVDVNLSYAFIGPIPSIEIPFGTSFDLAPSNNYNANISIGYLLFDFNRRKEMINLVKSNKLTEEEKVDLIKDQLAYRTVQMFYAIKFFEKSIKVKKQQIRDLTKHIEIAKKLVDTGSATALDTLTSEVRLAAALNQKIEIENTLKKTKVALRTLLNYNKNKPLTLKGDFFNQPFDMSLDSLIETAFNKREELKIARLYEHTAVIQKNISKLNDIPTFTLIGSYGVKNGYPSNLDVLYGNWEIGIAAKMPLFNGFQKKSKIETATWHIRAAQDHINALKKDIQREVKQAFLDFNTSMKKLETIEIEILRAKAAVEQAQVQYESGVITNLSLLDAQTSVIQAELKYTSALYQVTLNRYKLMRAIGEKIWL